MVGENFNNGPRFIPLGWVVSSLVLDLDHSAKFQGGQGVGMSIQLRTPDLVSPSQGSFTCLFGEDPLFTELKTSRSTGDGIPEGSSI